MTKRFKAMWSPATVLINCAVCFADLQVMTIGEVKALGQSNNIKCHKCGAMNMMPYDLVAHTKYVAASVDHDNPPGRSTAWDSIVGNVLLKRALEIAIVGFHTVAIVSNGPVHNFTDEVKQIIGDRATFVQKCHCGNLTNPEAHCSCSISEIEDYRSRKVFKEALQSHLIVETYLPRTEEYDVDGEPYANVLGRVKDVRYAQAFSRAAMDLRPQMAPFQMLNEFRKRYNVVSADILKSLQSVACTIAEMEGQEIVTGPHMAEALMFRSPLLNK